MCRILALDLNSAIALRGTPLTFASIYVILLFSICHPFWIPLEDYGEN
jgi:hypothetical protein